MINDSDLKVGAGLISNDGKGPLLGEIIEVTETGEVCFEYWNSKSVKQRRTRCTLLRTDFQRHTCGWRLRIA